MIRRWWRLARPPRELRFPPSCACCGAEPAEMWEPLEVPYCEPCRRHTPKLGPMVLGLVAGGAGALAAFGAYRGLPMEPLPVHVLAAVGGALAVLLPWWLWRKARPLGTEHALRAQAVERAGDATLFAHRGYAERVGALNGIEPREVSPPSSLLFEVGVPVLTLLAMFGATAYLYDRWHVDLWVDNGTGDAVSLHVEGRELGRVAAGARASWRVPARPLRVGARAGARLVDEQWIERPRSWGVWIFNVGGRRCYEVWSRTYRPGGGFSILPNKSRRVRDRLFHVASSYLFQDPPREIKVERATARYLGTLGARRTGLRVVPCRGR